MAWYLRTKNIRPDGTTDCYLTRSVEHKIVPLWWQEKGLSFTKTGYGSRIPTIHMVRYNGKWRRVYCRIYSNVGTLFIGKKYDGSAIVDCDE